MTHLVHVILIWPVTLHSCLAALGGPGGLSRGEMSLAEVQCHLDKEGASDLVIDLIMNTTSDRVFQESILLAIALLEGGNTTIQVSNPLISIVEMWKQLSCCNMSECFVNNPMVIIYTLTYFPTFLTTECNQSAVFLISWAVIYLEAHLILQLICK